MNISVVLFFLCVPLLLMGQRQNINIQSDFAASGYDLVSYFGEKKAVKGKDKYFSKYQGVLYKFSSNENLAEFETNPENYLPQYGGWCAYAMGTEGKKVQVNPKTFEIREGKLYLFYNAYFTNTYESWIEEGALELAVKGDENWIRITKQ